LKFYEFNPESWNGTPAIFLAAGDPYHSAEIAEQAKLHLIAQNEGILVEKMESPTHQLSDAVERYETYGLWGETRLVELKLDLNKFSDADKALWTKVAAAEPTGNFLIVTCSSIASSKWLKDLSQHLYFVDCQLGKTNAKELNQWLIALPLNEGS